MRLLFLPVLLSRLDAYALTDVSVDLTSEWFQGQMAMSSWTSKVKKTKTCPHKGQVSCI
jgi:hypothetical protein